MNFFGLIVEAGGLLKDAYKQSAYTRSFLKPLVEKHCNRLNYELTAKEKKKVLFYYPMYTILACAEMYLALKGRAISPDERKRLTLVAAMATLCDDLIDEHHWNRDQIFYLLSEDLEEDGLIEKAKLLLALNEELKSFWPLSDQYLHQLKLALEWQSASVRQLDPSITPEEILHICRHKNGNTSLMFATLLNENWTPAEMKFIYQSAIVGQLTNDSFDIYFDTNAGLNTCLNRSSSVADAKKLFIDECSKLHQYVMETENSFRYKKSCISRMSCMHAFTLVAFDHLQQTEARYGMPTDWRKPLRKEMVTDMAFNKNRLKLVRYVMYLSGVMPPTVKNVNTKSAMKRKRVESSAVRSIGYDEDKKILEVEISETGRVYKYKDVPLEEYITFIEAPSIGIYYNKVIKEKYPDYEEVT